MEWLPHDFDGDLTFDEVIAHLTTIANAADLSKVEVKFWDNPRPAADDDPVHQAFHAQFTGFLQFLGQHSTAPQLWPPGYVFKVGDGQLVLYPQRFKEARLLTLDGADYYTLSIASGTVYISVSDAYNY